MSGEASGGQKRGALARIVAAASFLPPIGILAGAIGIVWGANICRRRGARILTLGALGLTTSVLISALVGERVTGFRLADLWAPIANVYDDAIVELTEIMLNDLVLEVEFYRVQHGAYPTALRDIYDYDYEESIDPRTIGIGKTSRGFFYRRVDADHYYLRSVGPGGVPFTEDDVVPTIEIVPGSRAGLLIEPPSKGR